MLLETYLLDHFVDKATFASLAGISIDRLDQLIAAKAVPTATYTCNGNSIYSTVFGDTSIKESLPGEYFRPECVKWVKIAHKAHSGAERQAVLSQLVKELNSSLEEHHISKEAIEETIQGYLPYFFNGTFGLCVADPSTGAGIVRKEMLQARLIELTANGCLPTPANISKEELLKLIDDYASSSMPFSPAEYERSSKKRLVDDLRLLVVKA
jgi:hypothetical protein